MVEQRHAPGIFQLLSVALVLAAALKISSVDATTKPKVPTVKDVLLVHGSWADASSWTAVIGRLQKQGFNVHAVQLRITSLADDVDIVRRAIRAIGAPTVVAAHSYGGAVISGATAGEANVTALVFCAAYALDEGETLLAQNALFPATHILEHLVFDTVGSATIDTAGFLELFATGLPLSQAKILAVVQKPASGALFVANGTTPGWRTIPSYYQVSSSDLVLNPDMERFNAQRMHAVETLELNAGHLAIISHAKQVSDLIVRASKGVQKGKSWA